MPKHLKEKEAAGETFTAPGHAYQGQELANQFTLEQGQDVFAPPPQSPSDDSSLESSIGDKRKLNNKKTKTRKDKHKTIKKDERKRDKKSKRKNKRDKRESKRRKRGEESS